jgi:hypothetical protein
MLSARVTPPQTALAPMAQMAPMFAPLIPIPTAGMFGESMPGEAAATTGIIVVGLLTVAIFVVGGVLIYKFGRGTKEVAEKWIDRKYK